MKIKNVYIILFAAFAIRWIYAVLIHPPESFMHSDIKIYSYIANSITEDKWYETHFFQPIGFPLILSAIKILTKNWSFWLGTLHAVASTLTLYFIWKTAFAMWKEKMALYVLLAGTLHVPWILYTGYAFAETFYTLLLSILLWLSYKVIENEGRSLITAGLWGLTFIVGFWLKGQHIFFLPLFVIGLYFILKKRNLIRTVSAMAIMIGLGLSAHGMLSYQKTGKIKLSAATGGLNLVEGKCPSKKNTDTTGTTWWSPLYHTLNITTHKKWDQPFSNSSFYIKEGLKCIQKNPWVMVQSLENIPFLFYGNPLWPTNWEAFSEKVRLYELFFIFLFIPGLMIYVFYLYTNFNLNEFIIWGLPIISIFLLVYIFKSEFRYRVPFDVFLVPIGLRGWIILANNVSLPFEVTSSSSSASD